MPLFNRGAETKKLAAIVASLPARVADWTPEQRRQFAQQSDRSMREQNGVTDRDR